MLAHRRATDHHQAEKPPRISQESRKSRERCDSLVRPGWAPRSPPCKRRYRAGRVNFAISAAHGPDDQSSIRGSPLRSCRAALTANAIAGCPVVRVGCVIAFWAGSPSTRTTAAHRRIPGIATAHGLKGDLVIAGTDRREQNIGRMPPAHRWLSGSRVVGHVTEEGKIELLSRGPPFSRCRAAGGVFPRWSPGDGRQHTGGNDPISDSSAKEIVAQYGIGVVCGTEAGEFAEGLFAAEAGWDNFSRAGRPVPPR